jgi:hypothetical protein
MEDQWMGWTIVFYTSAVISFCSFTIFVLFARAERQDFDYISDETKVAGNIKS